MRKAYPSETQDRFMVRLPAGMRDQIGAAARENKRTMNAEIVARLEASFRAEEQITSANSPMRGDLEKRLGIIEDGLCFLFTADQFLDCLNNEPARKMFDEFGRRLKSS